MLLYIKDIIMAMISVFYFFTCRGYDTAIKGKEVNPMKLLQKIEKALEEMYETYAH